jgi:hypothetical protein
MSANKTMTNLKLEGAEAAVDAVVEMKDFFFALQRNTTLKLLDLDDVSIHEEATSAMRECLALNTGLEHIRFSRLEQYCHKVQQSTLLSQIVPFLVLNRTLKELMLFELDLREALSSCLQKYWLITYLCNAWRSGCSSKKDRMRTLSHLRHTSRRTELSNILIFSAHGLQSRPICSQH